MLFKTRNFPSFRKEAGLYLAKKQIFGIKSRPSEETQKNQTNFSFCRDAPGFYS